MTREEAIKILSSRDGHGTPSGYNGGYAEAIDLAIEALKADSKESFYDGYAYRLLDFGKDTVLCKDCKYYDDIEDAEKPGYRECHYFSNWAVAHYMLPVDYCSCAKTKGDTNV